MWKTVVTSMQDYEDEMIPVCQAPEADLTRDASPSVPALLTLWGPDPRRWEVASVYLDIKAVFLKQGLPPLGFFSAIS